MHSNESVCRKSERLGLEQVRRLIAELPGYGVKLISKIQSHCENMAFAEKSDVIGFFKKSRIN